MKYFLALCLSCFCSCWASMELQPVEKEITVNGKTAKVLSLVQPDGTWGVRIPKNTPFDVLLKNPMKVPTSIHWHGLILPNKDDGVAFITQFAQYPGVEYRYHFPLVQAGTFWMHSHLGLQEQRLLSAPLIIHGEEDKTIADQEVVVFLADFSFTPPDEIYRSLLCKKQKMDGPSSMKTPDLVDVDYDAFLTNYRTGDDPEIVQVQPGKKVRLRVINGSAATNFFVSLGDLQGTAIAVDGNRIQPFNHSEFELAVAQRIDLVVTIPPKGGAFPIVAQGEGTDKQTGLILTTGASPLPRIGQQAARKAGALTNRWESSFHPLSPLSDRPWDRQLIVGLGGDMKKYIWTINGQMWPEATPLEVKKGERVEIVFKNITSMSHPMHLHGHVFQVTALNGNKIHGPMRDTVLVLPHSELTIQLDADNPGVWPLHCHILYHMEAGMFTVMRYKDFVQPL